MNSSRIRHGGGFGVSTVGQSRRTCAPETPRYETGGASATEITAACRRPYPSGFDHGQPNTAVGGNGERS
jgi:hypothetical protein